MIGTRDIQVLAFGIMLSMAPLSAAQVVTPGGSGPQSGFVVDSTHIQMTTDVIAEGGVVFSMPARYTRTGRLANGVRSRLHINFGNEDVPSGTPVFAQRFEELGVLWCAVYDWRSSLQSICFQTLRSGSARVHIGGAYSAPRLTEDNFIEEAPVIVEDPSAWEAFPPMEVVYVFDRWRRREVRVTKGLRVNGAIYRLETVYFDRNDDGSTMFRIGRNVIKLTPVGEESVRAEVVQ